MFRRVVVAFDGSERALDAMRLAERLTIADGEMILCCVHHLRARSSNAGLATDLADPRALQQRVIDSARLVGADRTVTPMFPVGASAAKTLHRVVAQERADLIVLGSAEDGAPGRVSMGGVARETLDGLPCAAAVAPVGLSAQPEARIEQLALGYDPGGPMSEALAASLPLCLEHDADLMLVTVERPSESPVSPLIAPTVQLAGAVPGGSAGPPSLAASDGIAARWETRSGQPAAALMDVSREVDLLVLGAHRRGKGGARAPGSVCAAVLAGAACSVLVVPPSY